MGGGDPVTDATAAPGISIHQCVGVSDAWQTGSETGAGDGLAAAGADAIEVSSLGALGAGAVATVAFAAGGLTLGTVSIGRLTVRSASFK